MCSLEENIEEEDRGKDDVYDHELEEKNVIKVIKVGKMYLVVFEHHIARYDSTFFHYYEKSEEIDKVNFFSTAIVQGKWLLCATVGGIYKYEVEDLTIKYEILMEDKYQHRYTRV